MKYNKIHVLRATIRVLFVFKSLKDETPLVVSILARGRARARSRRNPAARSLRRARTFRAAVCRSPTPGGGGGLQNARPGLSDVSLAPVFCVC